ncbi:hypothetical protein SAMN02799615_04246 [Dyella marensis]|uniref:Uncharacterized protein n=1 Tax=Dyella marensis TaxID=500610 RepID=A0A1I2JVC4_9GAMM|nr:hypothetical protein SAMN02799615_04246 [Dyella marensis]
MQQFVPFEDDWDALEKLHPASLIPFRIGVPCAHDLAATADHCTLPVIPSTTSSSPTAAPRRLTVPAGSSST